MIGFLIDIIVLCIVGGLLYWIVSLLPLPQPFKQIAMVAMILILLLWVLSMFLGGGEYSPHAHWHLSSLALPALA